MAGSYEKRKPFKGKKFHKDLREFKSQEIKRSLVHRARLRKNYFKLIEEDKGSEEPVQELGNQSESNNEDSSDEKNAPRAKSRTALPPQQAPPPPPPPSKRKPINYAERAKLAKQRKEQQREEKLERVQERRQMIEQKNRQRDKQKERLAQRTKSGQPVMGPKISNLLDKIRQSSN